jgi:serine/threonine protein phosphatase PrpC
MGGVESVPTPRETKALEKQDSLTEKHVVSQRPAFLELNSEQLLESKNHETRPILSPSDFTRLPWNSGYAESINAGKSLNRNEDQASFSHEVIHHREQDGSGQETSIPVWFFGVFDGHAGGGAAMYSSHTCHQHVMSRLNSIRHFLTDPDGVIQPEEDVAIGYTSPPIDVKDLIKGAIEQAFFDTDNQLREDRLEWKIIGGCTVIASIFLDGILYVANAGDCRAIIVHDGQIIPMSTDFTPETDRQRVQAIAYMQPQLLGDFFGRLQFQRRIRNKDVGQPVLCRDKHMTGWAYKIVEDEDVKRMPMVQGEGKRARLLATIATTRGFGDHDLEAPGGLYIKPFLSPMPEIRAYDLTKHESMSYDDVLISATDGLWERLTNEKARDVVEKVFAKHSADDLQRFNLTACLSVKLSVSMCSTVFT